MEECANVVKSILFSARRSRAIFELPSERRRDRESPSYAHAERRALSWPLRTKRLPRRPLVVPCSSLWPARGFRPLPWPALRGARPQASVTVVHSQMPPAMCGQLLDRPACSYLAPSRRAALLALRPLSTHAARSAECRVRAPRLRLAARRSLCIHCPTCAAGLAARADADISCRVSASVVDASHAVAFRSRPATIIPVARLPPNALPFFKAQSEGDAALANGLAMQAIPMQW